MSSPTEREQIRTDLTPPPGGSYSKAIRWGNLLFVSGQTPRDLERNVVSGPFRTQAARVYENLRLLAERAVRGSRTRLR